MMIEEPIRPFDWWMLAIEVGVLLLVAYEVGVTIIHQIVEYKRRKRLRQIEADLRRLIAAGEAIQKQVPPHYVSRNDLAWGDSVRNWIATVDADLARKSSAKAVAEFSSLAHLNPQHRMYIGVFGRFQHASGYTGDMLQQLNGRLDNLRRIAQSCAEYF
ncbi:MAG: hypothetical protein ABR956_17015 [Terracidiphilus sp.]|jgi:hypothetical protein